MFAQPRRHEWPQPGQPAGQCVAGRNHIVCMLCSLQCRKRKHVIAFCAAASEKRSSAFVVWLVATWNLRASA